MTTRSAAEVAAAKRSPKRRAFDILEGRESTAVARWVGLSIQTVILVNVAAVILETVGSLGATYRVLFRSIEIVSVAIFSVEYLARLATCTADRAYRAPVLGRVRFAWTPMALVDLAAILPFYLPMLMTLDLRALRALRLLRIFRLFKVGRFAEAARRLGQATGRAREEMVIAGSAALILLTLASSLLYYAEHETQPEAFSSIPAAAWAGVASLTAVGYGDVAPVTAWGKVAAAAVAIVGIGIFALPAGILASAFREEGASKPCPHCGEPLGNTSER